MILLLINDILSLKHDRLNQNNFYLKFLAYISVFNGKFELKRKII